VVGLVVGLGSYGEYVITLGGELLRERLNKIISVCIMVRLADNNEF